MNRLTRKEACEFIGCGMTKLYELERSGQLAGTYYCALPAKMDTK